MAEVIARETVFYWTETSLGMRFACERGRHQLSALPSGDDKRQERTSYENPGLAWSESKSAGYA